MNDVVIKVGADIADLGRSLGKAQSEVQSFSGRMDKVGKSLSDNGTQIAGSFGAISLAITGALGFAVKQSADFDTAIRKAGAIAGATADEFELMRQSAIDLGASTSLSASQVANAFTEMAARGFSATEAIAAMPGVIAAAEASGEDLALAAETVSSALNIWGLEADEAGRVADVLAMSANVSAAGINDLGYAFKYAGAPAAALGIDVEELASAIGIMTDAGLAGENAGTSLRASLLALNNPATVQEKIMNKLGFTIRDSSGEAKDLATIIEDVTKATEGMTEAERVATVSKLVGTEAVSGFIALMNAGSGTIRDNTKALMESEGAAAATAKEMKAGIGGALEELSGAFESFSIVIGDQLVPYVQAFAKWLTKLVNRFDELSPATKKFLVIGTALIGMLTGALAIFGTFLAFIGFVAQGIGALVTVVTPLITKIKSMSTAMKIMGNYGLKFSRFFGLLSGPIGWIITLVTLLISGLRKLYKTNEEFASVVDKAWGSVGKVFREVSDAFRELFGDSFTRVASKGRELFEKLGSETTDVFTNIGDAVTDVAVFLYDLAEKVFPKVEKVAKSVWSQISDIVEVSTGIIVAVIESLIRLLDGDLSGAWQVLADTVGDAVKTISQIFNENTEVVINLAKKLADTVTKYFKENVPEWLEYFKKVFSDIKQEMTTKLNEWKTIIEDWFKGIPNSIEEQLIEWRSSLTDWFGKTKETIITKLNEWKDSIIEWFKSIPSQIITELALWGAALRNWAEEQNEENKRQFGEWKDSIIEWFKSIPSQIITELALWGATLSEWFDSTKESITTKLTEWKDSIIVWFKSIPSHIITELALWWVSLSNWFTETKESISTKLEGWRESIINWFSSMPENIGTQLSNWWTRISEWFSSIPSKITAKLEEWWETMKLWFTSVPEKPEVKNMGKDMVDKFAEGNSEKKQEFIDKLGQLIVDVVSGALAFAAIALVAAGREIIKRMITGVKEMKTAFTDKAKELINDFKRKITEVDMSKVGSDIVSGLIRGIGSMFGSVRRKISDLASLIPAWAKDILDINSPSRVFEDIGMWTGKGLVVGIAGQVSAVRRKAQELANAAVARPTVSYSTPNANYGSFSESLNGEVAVSVGEQNGLLREIVTAIREGQVITLDGKAVGQRIDSYQQRETQRQLRNGGIG